MPLNTIQPPGGLLGHMKSLLKSVFGLSTTVTGTTNLPVLVCTLPAWFQQTVYLFSSPGENLGFAPYVKGSSNNNLYLGGSSFQVQIGAYSAGLLLLNNGAFIGFGSTGQYGTLGIAAQYVFTTAGVGNTAQPSWLQQAASSFRVGTAATNATATMSNLTNLTVTLIAGRKYSGELCLPVNNSVAAEGVQIDFNGGTATMTSVEFGLAGAPLGCTAGVSDSAALGTALTVTTATTGNAWYSIPFTCVCNAAGTLIPRFASLNPVTGTVTVGGGGFLLLNDMAN